MKTLCKVLVICLLSLLLLCGCGDEPEAQPDYSSMIVPPVDLSITDCISEQELTAITGYPMQLMGLFEENSQAVYITETGACQVTVNMMNQTRAGFDAAVQTVIDLVTLQQGVGDIAYVYTDTPQLMVYSGGYALDVSVIGAELPLAQAQTYTLQVAQSIVSKLPTE